MQNASSIVLAVVACLFMACADSKGPAGPDTGVPYFEVAVTPAVIAPLENSRITLVPTLPLEFEDMEGEWVIFSSDPDTGIFTPPLTYIDLEAYGNLFEPIWYRYVGFGTPDTLDVEIYAYVVSVSGDTLAWNYTELAIVRDQ